jgi:hypothetical protein
LELEEFKSSSEEDDTVRNLLESGLRETLAVLLGIDKEIILLLCSTLTLLLKPQ